MKFKEFWPEFQKGSKKYRTRLDLYIGDLFNGRHGEYWFAGQTKKFTDQEIAEIKSKKKRSDYIEEYDDSPKRMVELHDPDGNVETISWGEHLRRINQRRNGKL